jgi:hypothetical protein
VAALEEGVAGETLGPLQSNCPKWTARSPMMVKWGRSQVSPTMEAVLPHTNIGLLVTKLSQRERG